jgi:uncharacterized Zn finger protein
MAMYYRCKNCGGEHRSQTVQTGRTGQLAVIDYADILEQCPKTGSVTSYDKKDVFWKNEVPRMTHDGIMQ